MDLRKWLRFHPFSLLPWSACRMRSGLLPAALAAALLLPGCAMLSRSTAAAQAAPPAAAAMPPSDAVQEVPDDAPVGLPVQSPVLQLGPGDEVKMDVFGQEAMDSDMYVSDDGTMRVPLAGPVHVLGLSPAQAAKAVEDAYRKQQILVHPQVTLTLVKSVSQRVSIFGQIRAPGRYPIESSSTLLDILAVAGGRTEKGDDTVYVLRQTATGMQRYAVNLRALSTSSGDIPDGALMKLKGGDRIYVPPAPQFYIFGEVRLPATYRLEAGTTVLQALALAGGVTDKGSTHRIEIKRREPDGTYKVLSARLTDPVKADDIITVKERIF